MRCASTVATGGAGIFSKTVINPSCARGCLPVGAGALLHLIRCRAKDGSRRWMSLITMNSAGMGLSWGSIKRNGRMLNKLLGMFGGRVRGAQGLPCLCGAGHQVEQAPGFWAKHGPQLWGVAGRKSMRRLRIHAKGDERILGESGWFAGSKATQRAAGKAPPDSVAWR